MPLALTLTLPAIALYLGASALLGRRLAGDAPASSSGKGTAIGLGLSGVALHTAVLHLTVTTPSGLNLGFFNAASLVGWLVSLLLLLTALRRPVENLGIALLPLTALGMGLALAFPSEHVVGEPAAWPLDVHILISVVAYSVLSIAAFQALLLAVQDRQLRHKHPGGFIRALPPLAEMEEMLFRMIAVGFVLLTLGLLSGALFLEDIFAQHLVHKTVLSIAAWVVFAVLLWGRRRFGWRGRTAIRWTLGGVASLMLAYFGSKLVLELILSQ